MAEWTPIWGGYIGPIPTNCYLQKCLEEKEEILQGKISLLEDQLVKLGDCSTQEKGEVMGDVLKVWTGWL